VIDAPESVQRQRASGRDGQTLASIQAIMDKQLPRQQRLSLADDVADNSGDKDELYRQLEWLHHKYLDLAKK
jgi:dephospho-CoA kinase